MSKLEIVAGHYAYMLPAAFYPDYKKHGVDKKAFHYQFEYAIRFMASNRITNLCLPDGA